MAGKFDKTALCREWVHSGEEDTENETVFRPADYDFPLSRRPRESFQLKQDGKLVKGEGSASDGVQETQGTWKLKNDEIAFHLESEPKQIRQIASVGENKLVLKK
ncbi:MAG: hypothetical protein LH606_10020 [Cytophagaceae bacterium]|nr:hypothetical protein [Cytophagaceae bacterium]